MEWKWIEGGLQFDGSNHVFSDVPPQKAKTLIEGLDRLVDVVSMLRDAKSAFHGGRARYAGAGDNYSNLLDELVSHENLWAAGYEELSKLFLPRLPVEKIDPTRRAQFMYETLLQLANRVNAPKPAPSPEK